MIFEQRTYKAGLYLRLSKDDDGWSGMNFERDEFQRMIGDALSGRINVVISKDLSRFGRDYIEGGQYIEKVFQKHNIRYVAVADGVDTLKNTARHGQS
jgi:DNA invertase Pin-like site-specific DNA recombinase